MLMAQLKQDDLSVLADLIREGKFTSYIDRRYVLEDIQAAIRYSEEGHVRGKIAIYF
jgi:NADPH:quinone reductase-like Zn-dependent oxidoreductase